jgi:MYXO-CTERM domain-containing protein
MTDSTAGGNPGSEGFTPPGPWTGPDADLLLSTYFASFIADGTNDVVLRFAPLANTAVHRQIWGINGFELSQAAPEIIPEPSTFLIWALGLLGLAWCGRRRRTK